MNYTVETLEKSQTKFNYTVDAATYDKAVNTVYIKTKNKYNVPGFRKGHAPRKTIEGMYGPYVFFSDAVNELVDSAIEELDKTEEYKDKLIALDSIDDVDILDDGGVKFSIVLTLKPEVKLGDYVGLGVEKKTETIGEDDINAYISNQQAKQTRLIDIDSPAENGNIVTMDFVGTKDGVPFEGGTGHDYELELGSGTFIPGFEEQLVGVKAGEEREVVVTFPTDYAATELAGKEAVFKCTVSAVKKKELPALDDEFAKDISEFSTFDEYKADVKAQLEKQAEERAERNYEDAIADKVVEIAEVYIPDVMKEREAEEMAQEFEARLQYQGLSLDKYLDYVKMTREQLLDEYKESAEKRVKTRLVMEAIVEKEKLEISQEEIDAKLAARADESGLTEEEYRKKLTREEFDYVVNSVLSKKLMDLLKERNEQAPKKKAPAKKSAKKSETAATEESKQEETSTPAESETTTPDGEEAKQTPKKKAPAKKTTKKTQTDDGAAE